MAFIPSFEEDLPTLFETGSVMEPNFPYDVQLEASEGRRVLAHKIVLIKGSDFFKVMFSGRHAEADQDVVNMNSVNGDALHMLVSYFYTKKHKITKENVIDVLDTASYLLVKEIVEVCWLVMMENLDVSNCFAVEALADLHSCSWLKKIANTYIHSRFPEAAMNDNFLNLEFKRMHELLNCEQLVVPNEDFVLERVTTWIHHSLKQREQYFVQLLDCINLELISIERIHSFINMFPSIKSTSHRILDVRNNCDRTLGNKYLNPIEYPRIFKEESVIVVGGNVYRDDDKVVIERFNMVDKKWTELIDLSALNKKFFNSVLFYNKEKKSNHMMIVGGKFACFLSPYPSVEILDLKTKSLRSTGSLKQARFYFGTAVIQRPGNVFVYAIGGCCDSQYNVTNSVERWDDKSEKWIRIAGLKTARAYFGVAVLNNKIYVAGGNKKSDEGNYFEKTDSVEVYCPDRKKWETCSPMTCCKSDFALVAAGKHLYAIAGLSECGESSTVERYDPEADVWVRMRNLPETMHNAGACYFNGQILCCGGQRDFRALDNVLQYDIKRNSWRYVAAMAYSRLGETQCLTYDTEAD